MKKFIYLMVMAITVVAFTACSDSDEASTPDTQNTQDVYEKNSEAGAALSRLVAHLTAADSLPDNWKTATFEVDYGTAMNATTPTVRYAVVENVDEAAMVYSLLIGKSISSTAATDTWSMDGVGSLVWKAVNQTGLFATVDVNVKQLPDLTQICFVPASAMDENAGFTGVPYYYIGDVISTENPKRMGGPLGFQKWVCVKAADSKDNQSYWVSFVDPSPYRYENIKDYTYVKTYDENTKKKYYKQILPYNLGSHNYMINYIVLMKSIAHYVFDPDNTQNWSAHSNDYTVGQFYRDLYTAYLNAGTDIWGSVFPSGVEGLKAAFLTQSPSWKVNLFYGDHSYSSWSGDISMDRIICTGEMCYPSDFKPEPYKMNAADYAFNATENGYPTIKKNGYVHNGWTPETGAFIYCAFATGKELSGNLLFTPDPAKPFDEDKVNEWVRYRPQ